MSGLRTLLGAVVVACLALPGSVPHALANGDTGRYASPGTAVARSGGQSAADEGSVVCDNGNGAGAGGVCLNFGGGDAVSVADDVLGQDVAFQVCLDNNGDGLCTSPDNDPQCPDQIAFSHDDNGGFHNPVGPLPTSFLAGCPGGAWRGYVVFLCQGVHNAGTPHTHTATTGTATVTSGGEGLGTFCGGGPQPSRKPYIVGSGARYTNGGTAVARDNGQPVADDGSVVCNNGDNVGVGGFCTSFAAGGNAMSVFDAAAGTKVAFQVCIDNSGDGVCTSPDSRSTCPDQVFFSHDDAGNFYNPLGPIPTGFLPGCSGGPWNGYVVFLCTGVHADGTSAHTHEATTGTGRVTTGGKGLGTFCGGSHERVSDKPYNPGPGARPRGGCQLQAVRDATPGAALGGQDVSNGEVSILAAAGEPTANIAGSCELRVNGVSQGVVLSSAGIGVVADAQLVQFTAAETDVVSLCTHLTVNGAPAETTCQDLTETQVVPQPVIDAVNAVRETVGHGIADPAVCPLLAALAPTVDGLGQPGLVYIDPATGDTTVLGIQLQDCPPYGF